MFRGLPFPCTSVTFGLTAHHSLKTAVWSPKWLARASCVFTAAVKRRDNRGKEENTFPSNPCPRSGLLLSLPFHTDRQDKRLLKRTGDRTRSFTADIFSLQPRYNCHMLLLVLSSLHHGLGMGKMRRRTPDRG